MEFHLEFEMLGLPLTMNALLKKKATRLKKRERTKWLRDVLYATSGKRPTEPLKKARLQLTRYSSRCPDPDGLVASFKFVVDALVQLRILSDDNYNVIGMPDYRWEKCPPKQGKVHIIIDAIA
jgi:hypothetical protein